MFEKEIKFIGDFCFNQVNSLGSNFTLDKITSAGVHPAVVKYISAELDFMIYSDRRKLLQQSYFDYAGKEISDHFQKISGEIKKHKKISIDDSKKLIFQAVSFNINYLVRPRWSLMKLIFNDQPVISVEEMKMMLNYLYYYEYFRKVLNGYISKRNLVQISSTEFDILLNKIDNELLNSDQHQVISNSFTSMGDFFNIGGVDKNRIPLAAVEIFCKEKNLAEMILRLKKAIPNEVKRRFDKVEIERILFLPDTIQISEVETDLEDDSKTEQMIEALDAGESEVNIEEAEEGNIPDSENADDETFLSPEEEEALLSLYSEENKEEDKTVEETLFSSDEEISEEEFKSVEVDGVKTALDMPQTVESEPDEIDEETDLSDFVNSDEVEAESTETVEENFSDEVIASEAELEGIVDAIADDLSEDEVEIDNNIISDSVEPLESEIEGQNEQVDSEPLKSEIENEIVQEMISDYYSESEADDSTPDDDEVDTEEIVNLEADSNEVNAQEKIATLEDDLLNIFEGLDDEEFKFPEKERFSVDDVENEVQDLVEEAKEEPFSTETTDSFDEYLKSIDEIIFTENPAKEPEEKKLVEIQEKIGESPVQEIVDVAEPTAVVTPTNDKNEKPSKDTRHLRKKDLFSYLRRKEVKKIVSYIFANDEEDFTNTVERVMDCHSYKEASEILKAVFTSYKISPYSKEAITFTNAVSNYFRQA